MIIALVFLSAGAYAQNQVDALRYSYTRFGATAKNLSLGGAIGAVGADPASMSVNPAGLAQYRTSEFTFGLGTFGVQNRANYIGDETRSSRFNINLPNIGYVGTQVLSDSKGKDVKKGWVSYSVGIGMNRINNFWRDQSFEGINRKSSITHHFADRAAGQTQDDLNNNINTTIEGMAWGTYLIDPIGNNNYVSTISDTAVNVRQSGQVKSEGNMNEYNVAFAANYSNKLYVGGSLLISTIRFNSSETFSESNNGMSDDFRSLEFGTTLKTRGTGFAARLGFIYRASDMLRLGVAIQTPTVFSMNDEYGYTMVSTFTTGSNYNITSLPGTYSYKLNTPLRATASGALLFRKKKGFLSADLEYVDYTRAQLSADDYAFRDENKAIQNVYRSALNIRTGLELTHDVFRFRGGFAWYGSPYADGILTKNSEAAQKTFSLGMGIKGDGYYIDLAYAHSWYKDYYTPYSSAQDREIYTSVNTVRTNNVVVTVGFKFN